MGGRNILITFPSFDIKDEMNKKDWHEQSFASFKAWNGEEASMIELFGSRAGVFLLMLGTCLRLRRLEVNGGILLQLMTTL